MVTGEQNIVIRDLVFKKILGDAVRQVVRIPRQGLTKHMKNGYRPIVGRRRADKIPFCQGHDGSRTLGRVDLHASTQARNTVGIRGGERRRKSIHVKDLDLDVSHIIPRVLVSTNATLVACAETPGKRN